MRLRVSVDPRAVLVLAAEQREGLAFETGHAPELDRLFDDLREDFGVERFGDVAHGAELDRLHGGFE